ncbi:kinase-like protein [Aspergillus steynii IBT 23096]|uniref:Kinase-like protein n=1 Tax=Aspergillus steynii IBT 23096 TaxID=1392250 RepID=A0A2I2FRV9_9EURO|nr:kinase-like protein [Aspergillus steynii IBT 23096]PLB43349.1 kinase-like protein [Aspergillus steynii IBT 23096]
MTGEAPDKGCVACGWTLDKQKQCCYSSHVKLIYGAHNRGVWAIGSELILKERPDDGRKNDVKTLNYLSTITDIPTPKVVRDWSDKNGRYFVLQEQIYGQTLEEAWPSLSAPQRIAIADQVADIRKRLCKVTSTSIQTVDGGQCYPGLLFFNLEPRGPFHSDSELWDAIRLALRNRPKEPIPEQALENLKRRLPKCQPYVLTHCDLNLGNIMVKDGNVVAILDWEYAAYYPIWYEYVSASWGFTEMDVDWKRLLRQSLDTHEDAKEFWDDLYHLSQYPDLNEKGQEVLERLTSNH